MMNALVIMLLIAVLVLVALSRMKRPERSRSREAKMYRETELPDGEVLITVNKDHGLVGDKHYTDCVDEVQRLKREGKHEEAITLLLQTIDATEQESKAAGPGWGVAPWYYEQLAIVYRKEGRIRDEISILERFSRMAKAPGAGPGVLEVRLRKAKALLEKKNNK